MNTTNSTERGQRDNGQAGAPPANRNAMRHGLYSPRMGDGLTYPDKGMNGFRRAIEDEVLAAFSVITPTRAAFIHTAVESAKVAMANRYRRKELHEAGKLPPDLQLRFDDAYLRALAQFVGHIQRLQLPQEATKGIVDMLYGPQQPDASESRTEAERGDDG